MLPALRAGLVGLKPSATVAINERSDAMLAAGRTVFKLGLGQSPFPVPQPVSASLAAHAGEKDYLPVRGLAALREAVARHLRDRHGVERGSDSVIVGPGSKELMFLLQLVQKALLTLPSPSWVSYQPQARLVGGDVEWIPTRLEDSFKIDGDMLGRACAARPEPRVLILNYPNNPTGVSYTRDELEAIAQVARAHGVVVLSDEIYGEVHHTAEHVSIAPFYPEGTIVSTGLSKWCGAGGWRLGVFSFPDELAHIADAMAAAASETFTSTSAPIQHAAVRAFQVGDELETYLRRSRVVLRGLGRWIAGQLRDAGARLADPDGGFYLFPDLGDHAEALRARGLTTSSALCERLLEDTGVAVLPGSDFGREAGEMTIRLAFVDFNGAAALEAIGDAPEAGEAFLDAHCGRVTEGIRRMCGWLADG